MQISYFQKNRAWKKWDGPPRLFLKLRRSDDLNPKQLSVFHPKKFELKKKIIGERKTNAKKYIEHYPDYVPLVLLSKDGSFKTNENFK